MAHQPSDEVLRGDEFVQIDFGDESERFACQLGNQAGRMRIGNWLIGNGCVGVAVTARLSIFVMRTLIVIVLVIYVINC